ncbi:TPA: 3-deoxy-7-phosphoheptulonate synthase [Proteus mirabilis]|nr:3-deoxy-7-phosphoheptulonate synthase [Proteus mirabilis]HEK0518834.1 3-deoxy-7-phosphoheptulonate synthase [Proteus mirabilis]HEK2104507.1 3-deoxy-7-phosphoheptulonate synthase [Proteus mirabilis]HEK3035808.1 3-deoxy-7-phosphoheptulonate synthase [Proteus mirabilis]
MFSTYNIDVLTEQNHQYLPIENTLSLQNIFSISWHPSLWKSLPAKQLPEYPDIHALNYCKEKLKHYPPLILASEIRAFKNLLKLVANGEAFLLQGGDCAESFDDCQATIIRDLTFTLSQMSALIEQSTGLPVIKLGRMAGQYAKPRSQAFETQNGLTLPSYRGEIINGLDFSVKSREPDPIRMITAYHHSAATLNLLRAMNYTQYTKQQWALDINAHPGSTEPEHYFHLLEQLYHSQHHIINKQPDTSSYYVSHEALLLHYEESMTRQDSIDNKWYNCSAHMVWVGERTTDIDHAHIEYLRGIENPIGIKCSTRMSGEKLIKLIDTLNPSNEVGKIILIIRVSKDAIHAYLPELVRTVKEHQRAVIWQIDPMHGNTQSANDSMKTRHFNDIAEETRAFIHILHEMGIQAGGIHLEMTGQEVTECTGGLQQIRYTDLSHGYQTLCDPRLNRTQSLELAFLVGRHWHNSL